MTLKEFAKQISEAAEVSPEAEVVMYDWASRCYRKVKISPRIFYGDKDKLGVLRQQKNGSMECMELFF